MNNVKEFVCYKCKKTYKSDKIIFICEKCGYSLDVIYDYSKIKKLIDKDTFYSHAITHWKYWPFYPIKDIRKAISMQEGATPLIPSKNNKNLFYKFEGVNPTGVFKDRGSSIEITKALEANQKEIVCASTGNMGASIAAYSQRANLKATIYVPSFAPKTKLKQIESYGAEVKIVRGSYDTALNKTLSLRKKNGVYLTGDYPYRTEGQKSVGFEILDQLMWDSPNYIVCPVGNGSLIYAVFKACEELKKTRFIKKIPKIIGVQARACNPIERAFNENLKDVPIMKNPKTIATAINCGNPVNGLEALHAIKKSKGLAVSVTDNEMKKGIKELGKEGIYPEISSASIVSAIKKLELRGKVVAIITGHGLKNPV